MKELITNRRTKVIIDDFNYERLKHLPLIDNGNSVVVSTYNVFNHKTIRVPLSKIILLTDKPIVDHKDGNHLNFQISNLRPCSQMENNRNVRKYRTNTSSKYKGVSFVGGRKKNWLAQIGFNNKRIKLGVFATQEEAAKAYNEASEKYHGEFGVKNVIQ